MVAETFVIYRKSKPVGARSAGLEPIRHPLEIDLTGVRKTEAVPGGIAGRHLFEAQFV